MKFDQSICDQHPYCPVARICPAGAMHVDRKTFRPVFDQSKCTGCELCISSCPKGAITPE